MFNKDNVLQVESKEVLRLVTLHRNVICLKGLTSMKGRGEGDFHPL